MQILDGRRVRQPEIGTAQFRQDLWKEPAEPLDVRLIDDGLAPGNARRYVTSPVERGIDDDAARHRGGIIAWAAAMVVGAWSGTGIIAIDRTGVVESPVDGTRVGIDEQLGRIEAQTDLGTIWTVDAIAVDLTRPQTRDIAVPDVAGAFG